MSVTARRHHRLTVSLLVLAGAPIVPVASAEGATRYVDGASVGGRCSDNRSAAAATRPATPLCSIRRGLSRARSGDTILVRRGGYPQLRVSRYARRKRVRVAVYPGERPSIRGMVMRRVRGIEFAGFHITDLVHIERLANIAFTGNLFTEHGIVFGGGKGVRIANNRFEDLTIVFNRRTLACMRSRCGHAVAIASSSGVRVTGNTFLKIPKDGVLGHRVSNVLIQGNSFSEISPFVDKADGHSDSIELATPTRNVRIIGNTFRFARGPILVITSRSLAAHLGFQLINNSMTQTYGWALNMNAAPGARIIGNTAWAGDSRFLIVEGGGYRDSTRDAVLVNNVVSNLVAQRSSFLVEDYNVIGRGYHGGAHDVVGQPQFVSPTDCGRTQCDYRLSPQSIGNDSATTASYRIATKAYNGGRRRKTYRYTAVVPVRDILGNTRFDLPAVANTGFGPVTFADRGAYETR
jgi:hypothetical protein